MTDNLYLAIGVLVLGLVVLAWSADRFVYGASGLARNFGISPLVIGITIVGMGSSAPEMMVAGAAAMGGKIDTAVGNALGSNITNICLVLGITALIKPLLVTSGMIKRELPIVLMSSLLGGVMLWDHELTRTEGIILLSSCIVLIGFLAYKASHPQEGEAQDPLMEEVESEIPVISVGKAVLWLSIGMGCLLLSSHYLVDSAVVIARHFGLSDLVIGLTIIAIGTSLPELAASVAGVLKGEDDLALGNIIGSNIFNILAVMAIPELIAPGPIDPSALNRDYVYMIGATVLLFVMAMSFAGRTRRINRFEGGALLVGFIIYQFILFSQSAA